MVDAQAVELARGAPAQHLGVGGVEDRRVVDADRGEVGDVEEAPVGQLGVAAPPVHEPVVLALVHLLRGAVPGARRATG